MKKCGPSVEHSGIQARNFSELLDDKIPETYIEYIPEANKTKPKFKEKYHVRI